MAARLDSTRGRFRNCPIYSGTRLNRNSAWLLIAFFANVIAMGRSYWTIPYSDVSLPDSLMIPGLLLVAVSAFLLYVRRVARFWTVTFVQAATVPTVVLSRVLIDGLRDPTSHNLWPLEILIASVIGIVGASIGAVAGGLMTYCIRTYPRT